MTTMIIKELEKVRPEEIDNKKLKELLEKYGVSQTELAKAVYTSRFTVNRWVKEVHEISNVFQNLIANYFNNLSQE